MELLWLYIPDWEQDGMMSTIKKIPKPKKATMMSLRNVEDLTDDNPDEPFWKQNDACSGFRTSDDCPYRASEMELISYQPYECQAQH